MKVQMAAFFSLVGPFLLAFVLLAGASSATAARPLQVSPTQGSSDPTVDEKAFDLECGQACYDQFQENLESCQDRFGDFPHTTPKQRLLGACIQGANDLYQACLAGCWRTTSS